jgi:ATP-dependent Zn protease
VLDLLTKVKQQLNEIAAKLLEVETLEAPEFYKMAGVEAAS